MEMGEKAISESVFGCEIMAAAVILFVSIVAVINVPSLDDPSQDLLQRFTGKSISKSSSESLRSASSDLWVDSLRGWSPNVFCVKNVYEFGCKRVSPHTSTECTIYWY